MNIAVGIDIGTTSIKALALDSAGNVVAKTKRRTNIVSKKPQTLEHNAMDSWHFGTLEVWETIKQQLKELQLPKSQISGVCVAAMVPSLTATDGDNKPIAPGILYGDKRGAAGAAPPMESQEFLNLLKWMAKHYPSAKGYWPAQTVANAALGNAPVLDIFTALTTMPLFSGTDWDENICQEIGVNPGQLPNLKNPTDMVAELDGCSLLAGTIDALGEMMVLENLEASDAIVIFGSTLICWGVGDNRIPEGLWSLPHTQEGITLIGGPSNAGGLFIDKVRQFFDPNLAPNSIAPAHSWPHSSPHSSHNTSANASTHASAYIAPLEPATERSDLLGPDQIPLWLPYINGERVPLHNPNLTAGLYGLDFSHSYAEILRAAYEASGFVIRRNLELAGTPTSRIIASGGGIQSRPWMEAVADATNLPIHLVDTPEGAALGAAWLAGSQTCESFEPQDPAGLNPTSTTIEPDPNWAEATDRRYQKFLALH